MALRIGIGVPPELEAVRAHIAERMASVTPAQIDEIRRRAAEMSGGS